MLKKTIENILIIGICLFLLYFFLSLSFYSKIEIKIKEKRYKISLNKSLFYKKDDAVKAYVVGKGIKSSKDLNPRHLKFYSIFNFFKDLLIKRKKLERQNF